MYIKGTFPQCVVLSNEVVDKEEKKFENGIEVKHIIKQRELSVNQMGIKDNIRVVVPIDSKYELYKVYDFTGKISTGVFNGKEWAKLVVEVLSK